MPRKEGVRIESGDCALTAVLINVAFSTRKETQPTKQNVIGLEEARLA